MPWYYIEVHSGGGHQSTTSKWVWRDKSVPIKTSVDIENFVDGEFDGMQFGGDSAIFHVKQVTKIPNKVKTSLTRGYEASILNARRMLEILDKTLTHPPRCQIQVSRFPSDKRSKHLMDQCVREVNHKGKCDSSPHHNREKFGSY